MINLGPVQNIDTRPLDINLTSDYLTVLMTMKTESVASQNKWSKTASIEGTHGIIYFTQQSNNIFYKILDYWMMQFE